MEKTQTFTNALQFRRSIRVYDEKKEIDTDIVKKCIQQATLAPNSSNLQLWEFHHVVSEAMLKKLSEACLGQSAASTAKQLVVVVSRKDLWKKRAEENASYLYRLFGKKQPYEYTPREKFALGYYKKIIPYVYSNFLGISGYIKYIYACIIGFFKPTYRQFRNSDLRVVAQKSAGLAAQTFMLSMATEGYDTCPMEGFDSLRVKKILKLPPSAEINMVISCGIRKPEGVYGERFRIPFEKVYTQWS